MNKSGKNTVRSQKVPAVYREAASSRMAVMLFYAVAVIIALFSIKSIGTRQLAFVLDVIPVLIPVSAGLTLAAAAFHVYRRFFEKMDECGRVFSSSLLLVLIAPIFIISVVYREAAATGAGHTKMVMFIICAAALYFVFYIFKRGFFWYSLFTMCGGAALALYNAFRGGGRIAYMAGVLLLTIAAAAGVYIAFKRGGMLILPGSLKFNVSEGSMPARAFYVSAAIIAAGLVLGLIHSSTVVYSIAVCFASYLVITIITTIKML